MKISSKRAGSMTLAIGLAFASVALAAAPRLGGSGGDEPVQTEGLKLFLADPDLGLAGRFSDNGGTVYFQARREHDALTETATLRVHIVDDQARVLAVSEQTSNDRDPVDQPSFNEALAVSGALGRLSSQLRALDLHPALLAEKNALAGAAAQASTALPLGHPVIIDTALTKADAVGVDALTDYYLRSAAGIELKRGDGGMLIATFGEGLRFESAQFFRADEENEAGELGRIDVYSRLLDANAQNLGAEFGGDWVPEGWNDVLTAQPKVLRDHDAIATDMGAGAMALNALALGAKSSYGVAFSSELEQDAMHRLARSLSESLLPRRDGMSGAEFGDVILKSTGRYRTAIQVHKKWLVWPTEHSATRVYQHLFTTATSNTYSVTATINFCNHGTCAGGDGMGQKCSYTGPRMGSYRLPQSRWVPSGQTGAGTRHTCSSNYGVAGFQNHNCHDDSSVQVRAIRGLSYSHDGGRCKDWDFWATAPGCS